ncbi:MAG: hypothetical protein O8C60_03830 [Candidatus Methanoperedens sp.]|nr:hypothetical protein [Candidatus Methanoperedens sp.]
MMMKLKMGTEIDWDELDRCWADMYEEDYGHFSDHSRIIHDIRIHGSSDAEVCTDGII